MDEQLEQRIIKEVPNEDSTSLKEKVLLMDLIRKHKPKTIVEIGTHRGLTTLYMAVAAKEVGATIDTYDPFEWGARGNFRKFEDVFDFITYHQEGSLACDLDKIDFIFCDGYHEKDVVVGEIEHFWPKLTKKAVVVFHDTNGSNPLCDVPGALNEKGLKVKYLKTENGLAIYEHDKRNNNKHKTKRARKSTKRTSKAKL